MDRLSEGQTATVVDVANRAAHPERLQQAVFRAKPDDIAASVRQNAARVAMLHAQLENMRNGIVGQSGIPDDVLLSDEQLPQDEREGMWDRLQPERIGLGIVLLEDAWRHMNTISRRSPTGLIEKWPFREEKIITAEHIQQAKSPLSQVVNSMYQMLSWTLEDWESVRQQQVSAGDRESPVARQFARLAAMAHCYSVNGYGRHLTVSEYYLSGFRTDLQSKTALCLALPQLYRNANGGAEIDAQTYQTVVNCSYGQMFSKPARGEKRTVFPELHDAMIPVPSTMQHPTAFTFMLDPAKYTLDGTKVVRRDGVDPLRSADTRTRPDTPMPFACPAPFAKGVSGNKVVLHEFHDYFAYLIGRYVAPRYGNRLEAVA